MSIKKDERLSFELILNDPHFKLLTLVCLSIIFLKSSAGVTPDLLKGLKDFELKKEEVVTKILM